MSETTRPQGSTRREFVIATAIGLSLTPTLSAARRLLRRQQLRVAHVGVGGMGASDLRSVASAPDVTIAALCDVDRTRLGVASKLHPKAGTFADYRRLLDALGDDIDAVVVSTPDHMHGPISLAAMSRGKHVYCQKPIAHNLRECRAMTDMSKAKGLVTQMGTQIHSHEAYLTSVATLQSGVIGRVSEAHCWVSKSWAGPAAGRPDREDAVPEQLDWNLWLGVAPQRPYVNGVYHPARWRGWRDFGSGTLGDMGCHIFDPVFSALELGSPSSAVSRGPAHHAETFGPDGDVHYVFPGTSYTTDQLRLRWTDGSAGSRPDTSRAQLPEGVQLPGAGSFLVGEKGVMVIPHWSDPRLYHNGQVLEAPLVRRPGRDHYHEWAAACRGEGNSSTPFSYSGPLTEAVLLGTIAGCFPGRELNWRASSMSVGDAEADQLVGRRYRDGWEVPGL